MGLPKSVKEVWDRIISYLGSSSEMRGTAEWLKSITPMYIKDNVLYLGAPTEYVREWIEEHYFHLLREALDRLGYSRMDIKILVTGKSSSRKERPDLLNRIVTGDSLLRKFTFDNFVAGKEHEMLLAVAHRIGKDGKSRFNPFVIYGSSGRGKTHLLHAIGNAIKDNHPRLKIRYVHAETFLNDMMESIRDGGMHRFRNRYRNLDVLLFDGLEFLEGKSNLQQEFLNTINYLLDRGAQVVVASLKPLRSLLIREEIRSRLISGLEMEVEKPSLETRYSILRSKAEFEGVDVPDEILWEIARMDIYDVRALEGIILRLSAYMSMRPDMDGLGYRSFLRMIRDLVPARREFDLEEVIQAGIRITGIGEEVLLSGDRTRRVLHLRYAIIYIAREKGNLPYTVIGKALRRNHSTIINGWKRARKLYAKNQEFRELVETIMAEVEGQSSYS